MKLARKDFVDFLPHCGQMLLIDCVEKYSPTTIHTTSELRVSAPFCRDGFFSVATTLEYAAQSCAIHKGLTGSQMEIGNHMLVRVREMRRISDAMRLPAGLILCCEAEYRGSFESLAEYSCRVSCDGIPVVDTTFTVFHGMST